MTSHLRSQYKKKPAQRSLEDVINVPAKATARIAWYPDDRPGMWMYHCHILEYYEAGMMALRGEAAVAARAR